MASSAVLNLNLLILSQEDLFLKLGGKDTGFGSQEQIAFLALTGKANSHCLFPLLPSVDKACPWQCTES